MRIRICLVALCLLVFYRSGAYGQTSNPLAEWEYKQLTGDPSDELLNHYAKYGWEIASSSGGDGGYRIILKRNRSHPLFGTKTPEPSPVQPPSPPKPTCNLTLAQAPAIRGLRLGMTSDELFAIFPAKNDSEEFDRAKQLKSAGLAPNYGHTNFTFWVSRYSTGDRFTGITVFFFGLFDGRLVSINAQYSNFPKFESQAQVIEIITKQFGLPEFNEWNGASLSCEGFTFQVVGLNNIRLIDPSYNKIMEDRIKADEAKKREGFKF